MCTGRVDLGFIHRAFMKGADGVLIGGCWPGECHYITEGNYDALGTMLFYRRLMTLMGLDPERLRIEWIAASEGTRYAEIMNNFVNKVKALGPLVPAEDPKADARSRKMTVLEAMIPYLRLVAQARLRPAEKSVEAYERFFGSEEVDGIIHELVGQHLVTGEVLHLLASGPTTSGDLADRLRASPSALSRQMSQASKYGLMYYDPVTRRHQPTLDAK